MGPFWGRPLPPRPPPRPAGGGGRRPLLVQCTHSRAESVVCLRDTPMDPPPPCRAQGMAGRADGRPCPPPLSPSLLPPRPPLGAEGVRGVTPLKTAARGREACVRRGRGCVPSGAVRLARRPRRSEGRVWVGPTRDAVRASEEAMAGVGPQRARPSYSARRVWPRSPGHGGLRYLLRYNSRGDRGWVVLGRELGSESGGVPSRTRRRGVLSSGSRAPAGCQ